MDCSILTDVFQHSLILAQDSAEAVVREVTEETNQGISWEQWGALAIALAVMVLPFIAGNYLAKMLKMPTHAIRFGCVLLAVVASAAVLISGEVKQGVDLRGGTILVYEINAEKINQESDGNQDPITSEDLVKPLTDRINPAGTQEIVIRPYGPKQIEIIIPEVNEQEVDRIKRKVEDAGILRFAIVANQADHERKIELAKAQADSDNIGERTRTNVYDVNGERIALWANVARENTDDKIKPLKVNVGGAVLRNPDTGKIIDNLTKDIYQSNNPEMAIAAWIESEGMSGIEVLMITEPQLDVTGEDLAFAASTFDQNGAPAVAFNLTDQGSGKFFALTTNNAPIGNRQRQLGIIMDDNLLSAPNILQPIRKEGRITGRFTRAEVEDLVAILKAGRLPAALTKQPIAENQIDGTLGADTVKKGKIAIASSLGLVLLFILFYYRFAGIVACIALMLNLAMILGTMVLINQPLTLPGLAGLVLTVGMSVDANVLIFERIREELKKGAAARMAIRNGFAKATVTIVDANLTTLITAIVLYAIGTDQIRGFAVTLILGILFSMFTAIYMSRTLFDVAERHGFLSLGMADGVNKIRHAFSGEGNLDFISKGKMTLAMSGVLLIVGVVALYSRGEGIFDIDFAGGSSVQFRLDKPTEADKVREIVKTVMVDEEGKDIQFTVNGVDIDKIAPLTVYKVDSAIDKVDELKGAIAKAFENDPDIGLVTYLVSYSSEENASVNPGSRAVMLTALRAQDQEGEAEAAAETETNEAAPQTESAETEAKPDAAPAESTPADTEPAESESTPEAAETPANPAAEGQSPPADPAPAEDGENAAPAVTEPVSVSTKHTIELGVEGEERTEEGGGAAVNAATLIDLLVKAGEEAGVPLRERLITLEPIAEDVKEWSRESSLPFDRWSVSLPLDAGDADKVMKAVKTKMDSDPVWISSSSVGSRVADDMIKRAFGALFASLLCIIAYIWFRFQRVIYGLAAVAALLHDVLITLGAIAVSAYLADAFGFLMIDPFKISLTVVAALLTIIGYSLNDTIVVFDRIRETKGKAPRLTGEMINTSINQTLSRTLLTSFTTLIVVLLLYLFGGEGIHAFAFALVIGVLVGTYSSIFVASPILLWLVERNEQPKTT